LLTLSIFGQLAIDSIELGLIYGLMSLGLSLTFGVLGVINTSHGAVYMLGGYFAFILGIQAHLSPAEALIASVAIVFCVGLGIELLAVETVKADPNASMLIAYALAILFENIMLQYQTGLTRSVRPLLVGSLVISQYYVGYPQLVGSIISVAIAVAIGIFLAKFKIGKAIRMISFDRESSMILGVSVVGISLLTFGIGASTAGAAGVLLSTIYPLYPSIGWSILIITFSVVILGGVGSIKGTMIAGVLLAFAENLTGFYYPQYSTVVGLSIIVLVLLIRPSGLFGRTYLERA
jgi:branched-chain amino acid transport system permease protein